MKLLALAVFVLVVILVAVTAGVIAQRGDRMWRRAEMKARWTTETADPDDTTTAVYIVLVAVRGERVRELGRRTVGTTQLSPLDPDYVAWLSVAIDTATHDATVLNVRRALRDETRP